jgi:hypothetical protein
MATLKSVKAWLGLFWPGCVLFSFGCAHDEDASNDPSEHHRHHGGGGRYGGGQGGMFDQSNPRGSPSPMPENSNYAFG